LLALLDFGMRVYSHSYDPKKSEGIFGSMISMFDYQWNKKPTSCAVNINVFSITPGVNACKYPCFTHYIDFDIELRDQIK
jgi:hypothetical protein